MTIDSSQLAELSEDECMELLTRARFGRIGLVVDGRPVILPVNYIVDRFAIVFRSTLGSKLEAALAHEMVAFEVDATDPTYQGGWSVLVHGRAEVVGDLAEITRLEQLPIRPWWPGARDRWLRILIESVSGRRLRQLAQ